MMVYDEGSSEITLKASVGISSEEVEIGSMRLGEGISGQALESGRPLMVENLETAGLTPAPADRSYKTKSFISYPITVRGRKIGLLNLLTSLTEENHRRPISACSNHWPQIAVAIERAEWQERATQFQLMSITDPLTVCSTDVISKSA